MPAVSPEICRSAYANYKIGEGQLCAGFDRGEHDSCQGDSGGPLVIRNKEGCIYQVGAVSWGEGCAREHKYGVYSRLSYYAPWIREHAGDVLAASAQEMLSPNAERAALSEAGVLQLKQELGDKAGRIEISANAPQPFKLGTGYKFTLRSPVSGRLILIDIDADHNVTQIFPNSYESRPGEVSYIQAGKPLTVPPPNSGTLEFMAVEPLGSSRLVALAVPAEFPLSITAASSETITASKGLQPVPKPVKYLSNILDQVISGYTRSKQTGDTARWALGTLEYEITK